MLFSLRYLLFLTTGCFLTSCATSPNVPSSLLPVIERSSVNQAHFPSKAELLQTQNKQVKNALKEYEKTGHANLIETNQEIIVPFGEIIPLIECTPLHTCDIKLEAGEKITGVYPGDTARWLFEEAISGENARQQMHVIFKPKEYDISTNAIITTTRRTYHVNLHSQKETSVKQIEFYYPEDFEAEWENIQKEAQIARLAQQKQFSEHSQRVAAHSIHFNYRIETSLLSKKPTWTPVHVFNDGIHVYIEMPKESSTTSLPALFVVGKDNQPALVNYRVQKPYYIVDELFQQAILEIGEGSNQQRVTLTYIS